MSPWWPQQELPIICSPRRGAGGCREMIAMRTPDGSTGTPGLRDVTGGPRRGPMNRELQAAVETRLTLQPTHP